MPTPEQIDTIRRLNDAARTHPGLASLANVTMGFQALPELDRFAALVAITRFTKFDGDNDPYGEHDFGAVEVGGVRFFWSIDAYDRNLVGRSPDPSDPSVTVRVLTIMRADEY